MHRTQTIYVLDDDKPFQISITRMLRAKGYTILGYTSAGAFLLAETDQSPACVVTEVILPDCSGLDLQKALALRHDPIPLIFVTRCNDVPVSVEAMKAGALDFLTKPVSQPVLLEAIHLALAWGEKNRLGHERLRHWRVRYDTLTSREVEVFEQLVGGKMNKQIASDLGTAERTIKAHRAQIMTKMQAASLAELVHIAGQLQEGKSRLSAPARP